MSTDFMLYTGFVLALLAAAYYGLASAPLVDENENPIPPSVPPPGPGLSAVDFPERNVEIAKDQPEYRTLPAYINPDDPHGERITCWRFTWRERLRVLFGGRLWCSVWTFNQPLQPLYFTVKKSDVLPKSG